MASSLLTERSGSSADLAGKGYKGVTARTQVIQDTDHVYVHWWVIRPQPEDTQWSGGADVSSTLRRPRGEPPTSLATYVHERLGWVAPLEPGFTRLKSLPTVLDASYDLQAQRLVASEGSVVADRPVVVDSYRRKLPLGSPTDEAGKDIRKQLLGIAKTGAEPHAVVWIQPKKGSSDTDVAWLDACKTTVGGFVGDRMEVEDLEWDRVTSWLAVIHTPWATFATWASDKELTFLPVLDARVRHWVVDPVILATAQLAYVQQTVSSVADMSKSSSLASGGSSVAARDEFYAWRARNWWPRPAKSAVASAVWEGAARANNTVGQVDALSREMADYAAVEEGRHHRAVEAHNVRLGRGALVFAIVAIVVPLVIESTGARLSGTVAVGVLAAAAVVVAGLGWWSFRSRISGDGGRHRV